MSDSHSTCPCRVTFLNLQDLAASLAPPVLHLPTTCPPGFLRSSSRPLPECSPALCWGRGSGGIPTCVLILERKERKTRCAYQVRALSRAPPASRSSPASCAPLAALAAAGALVVAMEAAVAVGRVAPGPRRWRSLSRASAGSTCRTLADAAGSAAQGWLLLLQRAAGGGRPTRVPTWGVTSVLKLRSLGVLKRVASGSLCSASASLLEPPKEKSCVERRGWYVTQSGWGSR